MSDVKPMEIQDVDMEKPMEIWEVKNMKISELKNMKFSNLTNMDISELIKNDKWFRQKKVVESNFEYSE